METHQGKVKRSPEKLSQVQEQVLLAVAAARRVSRREVTLAAIAVGLGKTSNAVHQTVNILRRKQLVLPGVQGRAGLRLTWRGNRAVRMLKGDA